MLNFLSRFFKPKLAEPKSMLTAQQACAIAEHAVEGSAWVGLMTFSTLKCEGDKLIWEVVSATIGAGIVVLIDDATGAVISRKKLHGR